MAADALIASNLSGRHQHAPWVHRALRCSVWRCGGQGHGEPDLAQGEERLGRLEHPLAGRRADCTAHSRRARWCARGLDPRKGDFHLAARRPRCARGRPKGSAGDQEHGPGRSAEAWRTVLDDLITRGFASARVSSSSMARLGSTRRSIAAVWDGVPVQRFARSTSTGTLFAHAPERLHDQRSPRIITT